MAEERKIMVLSPEVERQKLGPDEPPPGPSRMGATFKFDPSRINPAKRLDTLENKTIYLVDIGFGGGHNFVTTILRRKPGHVFADNDNELWKEIKAKGDAVILGVAG
jgi:hypothetical protein